MAGGLPCALTDGSAGGSVAQFDSRLCGSISPGAGGYHTSGAPRYRAGTWVCGAKRVIGGGIGDQSVGGLDLRHVGTRKLGRRRHDSVTASRIEWGPERAGDTCVPVATVFSIERSYRSAVTAHRLALHKMCPHPTDRVLMCGQRSVVGSRIAAGLTRPSPPWLSARIKRLMLNTCGARRTHA